LIIALSLFTGCSHREKRQEEKKKKRREKRTIFRGPAQDDDQ
jgi:hypothetical protein